MSEQERVECPGDDCDQEHLVKKIEKVDDFNHCPDCGVEFPDDLIEEDDELDRILVALGVLSALLAYGGYEVSQYLGMVVF